jgi:hypothetical protein
MSEQNRTVCVCHFHLLLHCLSSVSARLVEVVVARACAGVNGLGLGALWTEISHSARTGVPER